MSRKQERQVFQSVKDRMRGFIKNFEESNRAEQQKIKSLELNWQRRNVREVTRVLYRNRVPGKTLFLQQRRLQARLKCDSDNLDTGYTSWKSVIWSDETKDIFGESLGKGEDSSHSQTRWQ